MALVGLGPVDTGSLEHVVFGASIVIPLPETLEEVHSGILPRGVRVHSGLYLMRPQKKYTSLRRRRHAAA
jgi:hypothetical protein